jgi:membrane protease YdiL (CAAX protease family)
MNAPAGEQGSWWIDAVSLLLLAATLAPWVWIVRRLITRRPVLRYEPRRPVPWGALDIALVICFYFGLAGLVFLCEKPLLDGWAERHYAVRPVAEELRAEHSLFLLLATDPSLPTLALCLLSAVIVAPIAEEFLFRLLLQGWLEKVERRLRRPMPFLRRLVRGLLPIVIVSAVFAAPHYRAAPPEGAAPDVVMTFHMVVVDGVARVLAVAFGIVLVMSRMGATGADLGFVPEKFWADVRLGLVAALAVIPPTLWMSVQLHGLLHAERMQDLLQRLHMPTQLAVDPIPIFFFAVALGALYCRTHRIVPGIVVHMALNLTSLTLAWLAVGT